MTYGIVCGGVCMHWVDINIYNPDRGPVTGCGNNNGKCEDLCVINCGFLIETTLRGGFCWYYKHSKAICYGKGSSYVERVTRNGFIILPSQRERRDRLRTSFILECPSGKSHYFKLISVVIR